jgi:hypothetical protein
LSLAASPLRRRRRPRRCPALNLNLRRRCYPRSRRRPSRRCQLELGQRAALAAGAPRREKSWRGAPPAPERPRPPAGRPPRLRPVNQRALAPAERAPAFPSTGRLSRCTRGRCCCGCCCGCCFWPPLLLPLPRLLRKRLRRWRLLLFRTQSQAPSGTTALHFLCSLFCLLFCSRRLRSRLLRLAGR